MALSAPRLPTSVAHDEPERHATWLELFFDLVFVLAIAELTHGVAAHPSAGGIATFVALFGPVWWAWVGFTFFVTRFPDDDVVHRLGVLLAMFASGGLAMSVHPAFEGETAGFAASYAGVRLVLVALYARAWLRGGGHAEVARWYVGAFGAGAALWLASAAVPEPARYALWAAAFAIELGAPLVRRSLLARHPVDGAHLPERFGLFVIIVLGESVVAVGTSVAGTAWDARAIVAAALAFGLVAASWWMYFDAAAGAVQRALVAREHSGVVARDIYSYGHFPVVVGLTAVAAGSQLLISSAGADALGGGAAALLAGGVATFLVAQTAIQLALTREWRHPTAVSRLVVAAIALALAPAAAELAPVAYGAALAAPVAALTVAGARRLRRPAPAG